MKMNKITSKRKIPSIILEKKKMKSCSSVAKEIHPDIVFEVLTRLTVKALDRFKCVSKSWSSIIHQSEFMKAHQACGGILINLLPVSDPINDISNSIKGLFYASIHGKNEVFAHRISLPYFGYKDVSPVINGLACLYTGHQASLFNISTREFMELPSSSLCGEGLSVWYALGFDHIDNVYKLLKVSTIADRLVYEILTLETSSRLAWRWRKIVQEGLPLFSSVSVQSYFVKGIIYCKFRTQGNFGDRGDEYFLAFDVHQEHFTIFNQPSVPSCIRLEFKRNFSVFGQFEERLALARVKKTQFETVLEVWALEDHQNSLWIKHKIDVPDELVDHLFRVTLIGNVSSNELLICGLNSSDGIHLSFFIYDLIKKRLTKLMLELPCSPMLRAGYVSAHISCLMEKITPLDDLVGLRKSE